MQPFFKRGDHLRIWRPRGNPHDVICLDDWNGEVIHLSSGPGERKRDASVRIQPFAEVIQGHRVELVRYGVCDPPDKVIARARRRLGEKAYRLGSKNCQHFARECKTGHSSSDHVRGVTSAASGIAAGAAARAAAISAVGALGAVSGTSAPGITSALRSAGQVVGGGAQAGVVVLAAVPAVVATAGVHVAFADDPYATDEERWARAGARRAGTAGAVAGTVLGTGMVSAAGAGHGAVILTTGLKVLGAGRMAAGLALIFTIPLVTAGAAAFAAYWLLQRRTQAV